MKIPQPPRLKQRNKLNQYLEKKWKEIQDRWKIIDKKLFQAISIPPPVPLKKLIPEIKLEQLILHGIDSDFHPFNPAILSDASGIIIRTTNHTFNADYERVGTWPHQTINYWLPQPLPATHRLQKLAQPAMPYLNPLWRNWEDIRVFYWKETIYISFTTNEATQDNKGCIGLAPLHDLNQYVILRGYEDHRTQKNWTPLVLEQTLYFIYSWDPFIVLKYDSNGTPFNCNKVTTLENSGMINNRWKGGSPCLNIPELSTSTDTVYLTIIHESTFPFYKSRFVLVTHHPDTGFKIKNWSASFYFKKYQIEFAIGLAREQDILTVSFGVEDRECWLAKLSLQSVLNLL